MRICQFFAAIASTLFVIGPGADLWYNRLMVWFVILLVTGALAAGATGVNDAAKADNEFAFALLRQCSRSLSQPNLFLSPVSLGLALSMVENGARGATLREMAQSLQMPEPLADVNAANKALLDELAALDTNVELRIANAILVNKNAVINPEFMAANKSFYQAEVVNSDFGDPATVTAINNWASAHTDGKIPRMVDQLEPMLRLIVLDAIYFKGDWTTPFDHSLTHDHAFTLADGQTIQHPLMKRSGKFDYFENDSFQAASLPYGKGDIVMDVFLPKGSMKDLARDLSDDKFNQAVHGMESRRGTLELPRFKLKNEYDLKGVLEAMGMRLAFTPGADFSGISSEPLLISWVKQKTYVEVNEQGTVAAAVTGIGIRALAVRREPPPFTMIVDRPFLVAIRERATGLVLFFGAISDPRS